MQPRITARRSRLTPAQRAAIAAKLAKLDQVYDGITDLQVTVERGTTGVKDWKVDIVANVFRHQLAASSIDATVETATDDCVERMRRQLLKYKAKLRRGMA